MIEILKQLIGKPLCGIDVSYGNELFSSLLYERRDPGDILSSLI
jgi:hypothetical protein